MYSVTKILVVLSAALSVAAIPSHFVRDPHSHHNLAARVAAPEHVGEPIALVQRAVVPPRRRRRSGTNGRCGVPDSVSVPASTPSSSVPASTPDVPASTPDAPASTPDVPAYSPAVPTTTPPALVATPVTKHTSSTPAPTSSSSSSGSSGTLAGLLSQVFSGDGTFYATGLGACGITNNDNDMIAAASQAFFDSFPGAGVNPNLNPLCGRKVSVTFGGVTIVVSITDRCTGCAFGALDFSPAAFNKLADPSVGRIHNIQWHFV